VNHCEAIHAASIGVPDAPQSCDRVSPTVMTECKGVVQRCCISGAQPLGGAPSARASDLKPLYLYPRAAAQNSKI